MKITSSAFENDAKIPQKYTCDGENINPPLLFSQVPQNAKSLVLIMDDPDAPMGTFVHWVLYNIPPSTSEIKEDSMPGEASVGRNSGGRSDYIGPCPPSGTHRYFFKLYALDSVLSLDGNSGKKEVEDAMTGHILEQAQLIGLYSRS